MDITDKFYKFYNLRLYRKQTSDKIPAAHQREALEKLHEWFKQKRSTHSGGILVLPTGGGKTFTTVRFLCTYPLSQGYKVLWLAHTHHLLEQAFYTFEPELKHISLPKTRLDVRVVSGTPGHCSINEIGTTDDVLIGTLQTLTSAYKRKEPKLEAFLKAAGDRLFVVFDEAHHSPSPTYRKLIIALQQRFPKMYLLGLTATPTYTDINKDTVKFGWLEKLFPQRIIYQVTAQRLMADGILSKPEIEQHKTNFEAPEFDTEEYKKWVKSYQDLPEKIINQLAENRDRNAFIAETYARNKERYGKTLIFADRWFQCEQLREFLDSRGVRAGVVYSDSKTSEGHKVRNRDENSSVLESFRRNELDVLINVKMLTEGTDVPDVQTVLLTRETKSEILLTQMVGRALRGPKMGGTEKAYIVAFIDIWKYEIKWAGYDQLMPGSAYDDESAISTHSPRIILADLVRRLAQQMDRTIDTITGPFLTLLPLGWYQVKFETVIEGSEDDELISELVMVFQGEEEGYERFIENIIQLEISEFTEPDINFNDKYELIKQLCIKAFQEEDIAAEVVGEWTNESLLVNLFNIVRHVAQNEGEKPPFFLFEERNNHDLDALAQNFINQDLGPRALEQALKTEFDREDRYWKTIYYSYELFKQHYNACVDRLLNQEHQTTPNNFPEVYLPPQGFPKLLTDFNNDKNKNLEKEADNPAIITSTKNYHDFPGLGIPKPISSLEQWKNIICDSINLFYGCEAVCSFNVLGAGKHTYWIIRLDSDIDSNLLKPHLEGLMEKIQKVLEPVGYIPPEMICVEHLSVINKNYSGKQLDAYRARPLRSPRNEWILKEIKTKQFFPTDSHETKNELKEGDKVLVISGKFKNFEGDVIEVISETKQVEVSLSILGENRICKLDFNQVKNIIKGDIVIVNSGFLKGFQGQIIEVDYKHNIAKIKINIFSKEIFLELNLHSLKKVPQLNEVKVNEVEDISVSLIEVHEQEAIVDENTPVSVMSKIDIKKVINEEYNLSDSEVNKKLIERLVTSSNDQINTTISSEITEKNLNFPDVSLQPDLGVKTAQSLAKTITAKEILEQYATGKRDFQEYNLRATSLNNANLNQADLRRANLSRANLWEANLEGVNLQGANLSQASLFHANLKGANLQGADLSQAILCKANLQNANLQGTNLNEASLGNANLEGINLQGASLSGTIFDKASLNQLNLAEVNLEKVKLNEGRLTSKTNHRVTKNNSKMNLVSGVHTLSLLLKPQRIAQESDITTLTISLDGAYRAFIEKCLRLAKVEFIELLDGGFCLSILSPNVTVQIMLKNQLKRLIGNKQAIGNLKIVVFSHINEQIYIFDFESWQFGWLLEKVFSKNGETYVEMRHHRNQWFAVVIKNLISF